MSKIKMRHGSEGPRHDPYHFEEVTVTRADGRWATLHTGLAVWVKTSDGRWEERDEKKAFAIFGEVAGIAPRAVEKAEREKHDRRYRFHPCGQKHFEGASGYPGESFVVCRKCGDVIDYAFDRSAIE
jgi:hypothetical protein